MLSDVNKPLRNGPELASELEREGSELPVILMSRFPDDVLRHQNIGIGLPLLQKPFTAAELNGFSVS